MPIMAQSLGLRKPGPSLEEAWSRECRIADRPVT
jgi:hypothetical protein